MRFVRFFILSFCLFWSSFSFGEVSRESNYLLGSSLVSRAYDLLPLFISDDYEWGPYVRENLRDAKAIMIIPELWKGGLFVGAEQGRGILLLRRTSGSWSYPLFYDFYSASFGLQAGLSKSVNLLLVMTDRAFDSLLRDNFKFGGEINVAVGNAGGSGELATTGNLSVDLYSYSIGRGAYGGINVEGSYFSQARDVTDAYYSSDDVSGESVLRGNKYYNSQADRLRLLIFDMTY